MAKKTTRGGFRENAGRKPADPEGSVKTYAVSVPEGLMGRLDALAQANDWTRSGAVTMAIRGLVGPLKGKKKGASGKRGNRTQSAQAAP